MRTKRCASSTFLLAFGILAKTSFALDNTFRINLSNQLFKGGGVGKTTQILL